MNSLIKQVLSTKAKYLSAYLLAVAVSSLTLLAPAASATGFPLYEATYTAKAKGYTLKQKRILSSTGDNQYSLDIKMSSLIVGSQEYADFQLVNDQIIPMDYSYKGSGLNPRKYSFKPDYDKNLVSVLYKKELYEVELKPGTHNDISWQEQLRILARNTEANKNGYQLDVLKGKRVKTYNVEFVAEEKLDIPLGKFNSIHFVMRSPKKEKETHIWLAKDWDNLILRTRLIEEGKKSAEVTLKKAIIEGKKMAGL